MGDKSLGRRVCSEKGGQSCRTPQTPLMKHGGKIVVYEAIWQRAGEGKLSLHDAEGLPGSQAGSR